jgi:hypothetical protein
MADKVEFCEGLENDDLVGWGDMDAASDDILVAVSL